MYVIEFKITNNNFEIRIQTFYVNMYFKKYIKFILKTTVFQFSRLH